MTSVFEESRLVRVPEIRNGLSTDFFHLRNHLYFIFSVPKREKDERANSNGHGAIRSCQYLRMCVTIGIGHLRGPMSERVLLAS